MNDSQYGKEYLDGGLSWFCNFVKDSDKSYYFFENCDGDCVGVYKLGPDTPFEDMVSGDFPGDTKSDHIYLIDRFDRVEYQHYNTFNYNSNGKFESIAACYLYLDFPVDYTVVWYVDFGLNVIDYNQLVLNPSMWYDKILNNGFGGFVGRRERDILKSYEDRMNRVHLNMVRDRALDSRYESVGGKKDNAENISKWLYESATVSVKEV